VNATGVILHTNLGRAPLSAAAQEAAADAAGYSTVEYDLVEGRRARRGASVAASLASLCGAESAIAVNNAAAGLVLALAAVAASREVVVSRGELIEIGGSFRLPDMVAASGVLLREVGTTNRTRPADYREAVGERTGALLRVHPSNYRILGFTERPSLADLVAIADESGVPLVHDLGSGLLEDEPDLLPGEPSVRRSVEAGVGLVVFSGDKLLGGPQAGIVAGTSELVERCARHPLARAVRLDKLRLAALEATVSTYVRGEHRELPVWRALATDVAQLERRARALASATGADPVALEAVVGGGTTPGLTLPSWGLALPGDPEDVLRRLRLDEPPVVGRLVDGGAVLDLRTVPATEDATIERAVRHLETT
jgi:L-seryl-tRNA(Ser) seleniumtransferase